MSLALQGGGVYFMNGTNYDFRVANSVFKNNRASSGGALYAQWCYNAIYYNNVLLNNSASGSGGHIFQASSRLCCLSLMRSIEESQHCISIQERADCSESEQEIAEALM